MATPCGCGGAAESSAWTVPDNGWFLTYARAQPAARAAHDMSQTIPDDPFTQELQRIGALLAQGQAQQAAQALNQAQRQRPKDPRVFLLAMRLGDQAGNPAGAAAAAEQAVALSPGWHVALTESAMRLSALGQHPLALQRARQAIAQAPEEDQVLWRAAQVASYAGEHAQAVTWLQNLCTRQPDNVVFRYMLGEQLHRQGQHAEALAAFEAVHSLRPDNLDVLLAMRACAEALGQTERARALADQALALAPDDERARYWHAHAHGQVPATQPADTVSALFDEMAPRFDLQLVRVLQYKVPERTAQILNELYPERRFNVLDLGCGTGLLGVHLGRIHGHIIGVDLSHKMVEQAARHGVYSHFYTVNVLDALRDTPAEHYEVITCLDVLVYVGDLTPVIPNALRILKAGGHFIFSCEAAGDDEPDLVLRASNRYAHKAAHVERLCREAGFDDVRIEHLEALRMEGGQPLPGFLVVAHKPA